MSNPQIQRHETSARMSRIVVHRDIVYLAGVVAATSIEDIRLQTRQVLARIDEYLASVGTDKHSLLTAQIWLKDIERDFQGMNEVWDAWVPAEVAPTRATCEARLASPDLLVEIIVSAAL
jgi:enamine deaminase RidA (YjgF/YER057c/UK114 family)